MISNLILKRSKPAHRVIERELRQNGQHKSGLQTEQRNPDPNEKQPWKTMYFHYECSCGYTGSKWYPVGEYDYTEAETHKQQVLKEYITTEFQLTEPTLTVFLGLLPEWQGTIWELLNTSREIAGEPAPEPKKPIRVKKPRTAPGATREP